MGLRAIPQICSTTTETTIYLYTMTCFFLKLREVVVVVLSVLCYVHYVAKTLSPSPKPLDDIVFHYTMYTDMEKIYMCTYNNTTTGNHFFFLLLLFKTWHRIAHLPRLGNGRRERHIRSTPLPSLGFPP